MAAAWKKLADTRWDWSYCPIMNWYCVHTRPQKEELLAEYLSSQLSLETYLPRLKVHKTIRRVRRQVICPLFPRYLFCRFDLSSHYRAVRYAKEAIDIVHFGGGPTVVQDELILDLRQWADGHAGATSGDPEFRPGQAVEVTSGPMLGLRGIVSQSMSDRERVRVLLHLLETQMQLVIRRDQLSELS